MTVYLDIIFFENLCMNYIILFATGLICKYPMKQIRLLLSSILGSSYAVISFLPILRAEASLILKILLSIAMVYLAFHPKNIKSMIKTVLIFYLTSFAFGGCAFALLYFVRPQDILMKNGLYIGTYPIKIALLGGIVGFVIIVTAFRVIKTKLSKKDMFCEIEITFQEKVQKVMAMIDTGNLLQDPISRMPVVVVEKEALETIIPKEILENLNTMVEGGKQEWFQEEALEKYMSKFRVIPFSSLGKQHGMLIGFKADKVSVMQEEAKRDFKRVIIGIYDKRLSKNKTYQALIGLDMLGEEEQKHECSTSIKI